MIKRIAVLLLVLFSLSTSKLAAQGVAAQYDVLHYDVTGQLDTTQNALSANASIKLINNGNGPGRSITLRLGPSGKIGSISVNGATATFTVKADSPPDKTDTRPRLQIITVTPSGVIAPGATVTLAVTYTFPVPESAENQSIAPGDIVLLPDSFWAPVVNTPFLSHGPDQMPFTVTMTLPANEAGFSGGQSNGASFNQAINGFPFFIAGHFAAPLKSSDGLFEAYLPKGLEQTSAAQVNRIFDEGSKIAKFYQGIFGRPVVGPIRIAFDSRGGGFTSPSATVFSQSVARQDVIDAGTLDLLATSLAKNYIGGQNRIQDKAWGFMMEGMPRYLSALYVGERFGPEAEREAFFRLSRAFAPIAAGKNDLQLLAQTLNSTNFLDTVPTKGPLVLRIFANEVGKDKLLAAIRQAFNGAVDHPVTFEAWLAVLKQSGSPKIIDGLVKEWIETVAKIDLVIAVPRQEGNIYTAAVRNFGIGDATVEAQAITASGKKLTDRVTLTTDSNGFGSVKFETTEKLVSVEIDPEKMIVQTNYDNDARILNPEPTMRPSPLALFIDALGAVTRTQAPNVEAAEHQTLLTEAETKLRQAVAIEPTYDLAHAWLGRVLLEEGKQDEAAKEANAALTSPSPLVGSMAWADFTLGKIALARGQADAGIALLDKAAQIQADGISIKTARAALISAQVAGGKAPAVDPSVQQYLSQFDKAIISGSADAVRPFLIGPDLKKFATRIAVAHPTQWTTTALRVEQLDAERVAVDVKLDLVAQGAPNVGTALYYLRRGSNGWQLEKIDLFDVRELSAAK